MQPVETRLKRYQQLLSQLKTERSSFESQWRDIADYVLPSRARFTITDRNKGTRKNQKILDSVGAEAARTFGAGMHSGITNPARPWFRLTTPDAELAEVASVKAWLSTVTQRMATVFLKSNLYQVLPTIYTDLAVFGTAAMGVVEDDADIIRAYDYPIGTYYLANDDRQRVRTFVYEREFAVRQLVTQFAPMRGGGDRDWSRLSTRVRNLWENGQTEAWIPVVQVVTDNEQYDPRKLESRFKPFLACRYEVGSDKSVFLSEEGFDEFPIMAPRWQATGGDVYGTDSPGWMALGDLKQLMLGEKRGAQALDKMVNPPMVAPPSMRSSKLTMLPGEVSYVQEGQHQSFRPAHEVNLRLDFLQGKQQELRARVQRAFFVDVILMLAYSDPARGEQPLTAREVDERSEEKFLVLGPLLGRTDQDLLGPLVDRTFGIMNRKGMIPEAPQELQGMPLRVEYLSVMAQKQKMVGIAGIERFASFGAQLAEVDPNTLDKWDRDQLMDEYGEMVGVPPTVVVPDDKVAAIREARAKQQAAQQQVEAAAKLAPAAKQLSETDTNGRNGLTDLLQAGAPALAGAA